MEADFLRKHLRIAIAGWGVLVIGGFGLSIRYEFSPGPAGDQASSLHWIDIAPLLDNAGANTEESAASNRVVMIAHPLCPCTLASLFELSLAIAEAERVRVAATPHAHVYVVLTVPLDEGEDWMESEIVIAAEAMDDVTVIFDVGGVIAARCGIETSGHTLVFDASGDLQFLGGITSSRGQRGENPGKSQLMQAMSGVLPNQRSTPVFGCLLVQPADQGMAQGAAR